MAEGNVATMGLTKVDGGYCATITPPQTTKAQLPAGGTLASVAGKGGYCFVIDVSGSMNAAASITTDDGDKVNHGWSQLDIAKHSTNTFVSSLGEEDYFSVVTYSDGAKVLLDWTKCDAAGRERAITAIHSMKPERSTNLMAGITSGFTQFEKFPVTNVDELKQYALNLFITTDGMPSAQWHPARGVDGYAPLVKMLSRKLASKNAAAPPVITSIGIGFQLDSKLLLSMSQTFLHMPDPGQIGPFTVNLLAAVRSTAQLPGPAGTVGTAANHCALLVSPMSALDAIAAPCYVAEAAGPDTMKVHIGPMAYDQPRHVMLRTTPGDPPISVQLVVSDTPVAGCSANSATAAPPTAAMSKQIAIEELRLKAIGAIEAAQELGLAMQATAQVQAPIRQVLEEIRSSSVASEACVSALAETLESECLLGCDQAANFKKWGTHYFRTLPCMLRAERRSNFRDQALQHFGKDATGAEALFEELSQGAEMQFATLKPPEPSLLNQPTPAAPAPGGGGVAATPPPPRAAAVYALPDEFMRGGGCFGPKSTVQLATEDGVRLVSVAEVRAGDRIVGVDGSSARVVCVVMTECAAGRAMLTRLPNGVELTEWHPMRDQRGQWRFPIMLGERVIVPASHVYNFVLERGQPTVMVGGVQCAALGHGLSGPVVAHPYWGTRAVIDDLMAKEGWNEGRVVLPAHVA